MAGGASIDINADVGESFGPWPMGHDEALMSVASTVNIACGFHAGDPVVIARTIEAAVRAGLAIGAHPGYPDREGFGRRELVMSPDELEASVLYQVAAVAGMVAAAGGKPSMSRRTALSTAGAPWTLASPRRSPVPSGASLRTLSCSARPAPSSSQLLRPAALSVRPKGSRIAPTKPTAAFGRAVSKARC